MIEQLIQLVIEPRNDCLLKGEHGRVPIRIRTYSTVDQEEELGKSLGPTESSDDDDPKHPEPGTAFTYEEWKEGKNESFREKERQVFVQFGSIELGESDHPFSGSDWDIDGTRTNVQISFRQKTYMSESAYNPLDDDLFAKTFGIGKVGHYDDNGFHSAPATQELGSIAVKEERLLSWSNSLQYKVEPFTRSIITEPGHARFVKLMLVDPHYRICSTQNVPPQRHDGWASEVFGKQNLGGNLPRELLNLIDKAVDGWPIGRDEAEKDRGNLLEKHRWAKEAEAIVEII
ncbi:hypothetical protein BOTCAL_0005g00340 [Botryotinia calthae]|uniref:DUF4246 domain-containing protein n=1 Tax=Botryotinia calthae TaxID=38488 RepID=A0A4Y8DH76_9HELO|nr:hypothetical protein BOTCAL_0005g00340 [Botryotinia calthae]